MVRMLASGAIPELYIHKSVMQWVRLHPYLSKFILHFPNEGKRSLAFGRQLKELGMLKGVADLLIAMPKQGFCGAWIELKSEHGVVSQHQKDFLNDMTSQNYFVAIAWSFEEAIAMIGWYCLDKQPTVEKSHYIKASYRTDIQLSVFNAH